VTAPSTTVTSPQSTVTEIPITNPPTTIITYPNPYQPSYDTIDALASDSVFIVIATVKPEDPTVGGYPLDVQLSLGANPVRIQLGILPAEFAAAHLTVGGTYVIFYGVDTDPSSVCVVGGVRGVFVYNATTQIVTRLDQNATSRIPHTQTLAQLEDAINASERAAAGQPSANLPPVCSSSATGL
jgi:hypothetical protein